MMTAKTVSLNGRNLIKGFEGLRLKAYQDQVGTWTNGWGHTRGVRPGQVITKQTAELLLSSDLAGVEHAINALVHVPLTQNQFDALASFVFNLGAHSLQESTLLRLLNQGKYKEAGEQFPRWDHAGREEVAGLLRRREAEQALWDTP